MLPISNVITGSITGRKNPNVVFANDEKEAGAIEASKRTANPDLEIWFELLKSYKPELRKRVYYEIEKAGKEAIPYLELGMKDPDPYVRRDLIYFIGKLKLEEKIPTLVKALSDAVVSHAAKGALLNMGNKSVPELAKTLEKLDPEIDDFHICNIVDTLYTIGKDAGESVGQLNHLLHRTTNIELTKGILNTLSRIGSGEAITILTGRAMDSCSSTGIRNHAVVCLAEIARNNVEKAI